MKKCRDCQLNKPLTEFARDKYKKDGYGSLCKSCKRQREADRLSKNPELRKRWKLYHYTALGKARSVFRRANRKGVEVLPAKNLETIFCSLPMRCHYCNTELTWETCQPDRKDPQKGYVDGNITFACDRCNRVKTDILTEQQMLEVAQRFFIC